MKNKILYIVLFFIFATTSFAQNIRNNITLELTGGVSSFAYKANVGDRKGMPGTSAAIKYQYNIDWNWSVGLGAEVKMYQSSLRFDEFRDSYKLQASSLLTGKADEMTFTYSYKNLEERQRALYINIPIYIQYRSDAGAYIRVGAKVGMPVKSESDIYFEELHTQGHFLYENVTYTNLPQHGFGTFYDTEVERECKMNLNAEISAELGWSWDWNERYILYLGAFGEYGFSNLYTRGELKPQLQYNAGELEYTPILSASISEEGERRAITGDKIRPFSVGLLIRYSFGF